MKQRSSVHGSPTLGLSIGNSSCRSCAAVATTWASAIQDLFPPAGEQRAVQPNLEHEIFLVVFSDRDSQSDSTTNRNDRTHDGPICSDLRCRQSASRVAMPVMVCSYSFDSGTTANCMLKRPFSADSMRHGLRSDEVLNTVSAGSTSARVGATGAATAFAAASQSIPACCPTIRSRMPCLSIPRIA